MTTITFTPIEADVLEHRLSHLAELDEDDLAELFPGFIAVGLVVAVDVLASAFGEAVLKGMAVTIEINDQSFPAILEEALEGSTHHEMADESEGMGMITPQKRAAYRKAMQTAAEKVSAITGREIKLP